MTRVERRVRVTDTAVRNYATHVIIKAALNRDVTLSDFTIRTLSSASLKVDLETIYSSSIQREFPKSKIPNYLQSIREDRKDVSFRSSNDLSRRPRSLLERGMFAVVATTASRVNSHYYYLSKRVSRTAEDERGGSARPFVGKANANKIK